MAITVEQYAALGVDANGNLLPVPDAESYLGVVAAGDPFNDMTNYIVVTSDADDLCAIGPDGSEGTPSISLTLGVQRVFRVPRNAGWAIVI